MVSVTIPSSAVLQNLAIGRRMLPSLTEAVKSASRKCLRHLKGLKYAYGHASGENVYNDPSNTASFLNPSPSDASVASLVIYGAHKEKVLVKIGQTTSLRERKKADEYANHDLVCLIHLDGVPLRVAEALRTELEAFIRWIIDPVNNTEAPVCRLFKMLLESAVEYGPGRNMISQLLESAVAYDQGDMAVLNKFGSYPLKLRETLIHNNVKALKITMNHLRLKDLFDGKKLFELLVTLSWAPGLLEENRKLSSTIAMAKSTHFKHIDNCLEALHLNATDVDK